MTDHVDSEVYDAHEAFEIDETKMKMLVPLDMNNKKIMNVNYDLKFGDLFKIIKCYVPPPSQTNYGILTRKSDNQHVSFSNPVVLHAIIMRKKFSSGKPYVMIVSGRGGTDVRISFNIYPYTILLIFERGIRFFRFHNIGQEQLDADIAIIDM